MKENGVRNVSKELCLVQMYEEVEFDNRVQCPILNWCPENSLPYEAIDASNILKAIHIVPNFENESHYFLNLYKF